MKPVVDYLSRRDVAVVGFAICFLCLLPEQVDSYARLKFHSYIRDKSDIPYDWLTSRVNFTAPDRIGSRYPYVSYRAHKIRHLLPRLKSKDIHRWQENKVFKKVHPNRGNLTTHFNCKKPSFSVVWNVPTHRCLNFGLDIDSVLTRYGIKHNRVPSTGWLGPEIALIYSGSLGLYPYISGNGTFINGGIPQLGNITAHLEKATKDLSRLLPDVNFSGLGVIDWESWRPVWERNFDSLKRYQTASEDYVRHRHPTWTPSEVTAEARREYEAGVRSYMEQTVKIMTRLRPRGKWGYYLFPECYNHQGQRHCDHKEQRLNKRLAWLFNASTATYPSAYLEPHNITFNRNYIHGQIGEALRIRNEVAPHPLPLYLYTRFRYAKSQQYYSKDDVRSGLDAACHRGMDGVTLWDDHLTSNTKQACTQLLQYIDDVIGHAIDDLR